MLPGICFFIVEISTDFLISIYCRKSIKWISYIGIMYVTNTSHKHKLKKKGQWI